MSSKFKFYLRQRRIKQAVLAKVMGVDQTLISLWCTGKCKPPITRIPELSIALGTTIEETVLMFCKSEEEEAKMDEKPLASFDTDILTDDERLIIEAFRKSKNPDKFFNDSMDFFRQALGQSASSADSVPSDHPEFCENN